MVHIHGVRCVLRSLEEQEHKRKPSTTDTLAYSSCPECIERCASGKYDELLGIPGGDGVRLAKSNWLLQAEIVSELETLHVGQFDNLKYDAGGLRVFVSRLTVDDGEPWDNKLTVYRKVDNDWVCVQVV